MNILNRITRYLSGPPKLRSQQWDGDAAGRFSNYRPPITTPNAWMDNPILLRSRAENEFRNNAYGFKSISATVTAAVGASGLYPQFKDPAVTEAFRQWADSVDASGRSDWAGFVGPVFQKSRTS